MPIFCEMTKTLKVINSRSIQQEIKSKNLWTPSVISGGRDNKTRKNLMAKMSYGAENLPKCMISGISGNGNEVICGHLVPCSSPQDKLAELAISPKDVNKLENCVFWCQAFESAYENLKISFVRNDPLHDVYSLHIWDNSVRDDKLFSGRTETIGQYEGRNLDLGSHVIWKRALSYQAYQAYIYHKAGCTSIPVNQTLYGSPDNPFYNYALELQKDYLRLVQMEAEDEEEEEDDEEEDDEEEEEEEEDDDDDDDDDEEDDEDDEDEEDTEVS